VFDAPSSPCLQSKSVPPSPHGVFSFRYDLLVPQYFVPPFRIRPVAFFFTFPPFLSLRREFLFIQNKFSSLAPQEQVLLRYLSHFSSPVERPRIVDLPLILLFLPNRLDTLFLLSLAELYNVQCLDFSTAFRPGPRIPIVVFNGPQFPPSSPDFHRTLRTNSYLHKFGITLLFLCTPPSRS